VARDAIRRRIRPIFAGIINLAWLVRSVLRRRGNHPTFAAEVSGMPKVEIYTQPWCPFCERAMHILSAKQVEFQEIDAPHGSAARDQAKRRSGGRTTVPQIFIDDRHIGGCDDLVALDRAGKLDPLLTAT
jgi:glutaredoxin 3